MGRVAAVARWDLRLTLADRSAVMWMFVLPVVFAVFFGLVMAPASTAPGDPQARLTLVDADRSPVSRAFVDALGSERLDLIEIEPAAKDTTADKIRTLVIPPSFGTQVLAGTQVTVRLEKDPGTSAEAALVAQARIVAAIARLVAQLVEAERRRPEGADITADELQSVTPEEDLIRVEARFAGRARTAPDGFAQTIPGYAVMFTMLVALTYGAASITAEREGGLLRRLASTPLSATDIVVGKLLGRLTIAGLQVTVFALAGEAGRRLFDLEIANLFSAWVVLLVFALTVAPLGLVVGGLFRDPDRAASVGVIATVVMAAMGGCWWPIEVVSPTLQRVALVLPTGWAMRALHGVLSFGHPLAATAPSLLVLLGFAATFTIAAVKTLRVQ